MSRSQNPYMGHQSPDQGRVLKPDPNSRKCCRYLVDACRLACDSGSIRVLDWKTEGSSRDLEEACVHDTTYGVLRTDHSPEESTVRLVAVHSAMFRRCGRDALLGRRPPVMPVHSPLLAPPGSAEPSARGLRGQPRSNTSQRDLRPHCHSPATGTCDGCAPTERPRRIPSRSRRS